MRHLGTLVEVLSANGNAERAELLKQHADEEVCTLVLSLIDKVGELWRGLTVVLGQRLTRAPICR